MGKFSVRDRGESGVMKLPCILRVAHLLASQSQLNRFQRAHPLWSIFVRHCSRGCEVSIKELDTLLALLAEKKRKMEQEEVAWNVC